MSQIKAVPDSTVDPKAAKERRVSETFAPYFNLKMAIELAAVIQKFGGNLDRMQLASKAGYSGPKNGAFLTRVSAAKIFGLVDQVGQSDMVRITERGRSIVAPVSDAEAGKAKLEAFMSVELFKKVFDEYRGRELPADVGLANLFEHTYKIIPTRAPAAVKVMLDSAETAGLFSVAGVASRKMILPVNATDGSSQTHSLHNSASPPPPPSINNGGGSNGGGHGGGGNLPPNIDPAFVALLTRLPAAGSPLSSAKRQSLIEVFTATVNWIYPSPEND